MRSGSVVKGRDFPSCKCLTTSLQCSGPESLRSLPGGVSYGAAAEFLDVGSCLLVFNKGSVMELIVFSVQAPFPDCGG